MPGKQLIYLLLIFVMIGTSYCVSGSKVVVDSGKDIRTELVEYGRTYLGSPYRYAGRSPKGFDCSGFTTFVFKRSGITLPPISREQAKMGDKRSPNKVRPGDLLFFADKGGIDHVGIVTQNDYSGLFLIHSTSRGVVEEDISRSAYWQKRMRFGRDLIGD